MMLGSVLRSFRLANRLSARRPHTASDLLAIWLGGARLGKPPTMERRRRRHNRWKWHRRCELVVRCSGAEQCARAFDLCASGAGLLMPERPPVGSTIQIGDGHSAIWIEARVIHAGGPDEAGLFRVGVEFLQDSHGAGEAC